MIATLTGEVAALGRDYLVLETGGVGYLVYATARTIASLPSAGEKTKLWTSLQVREDSMSLYGFATQEERGFFESLLGVTGIGPKVAMGVVASAAPAELGRLLATGDVVSLMAMPGVGKKLAQRLVLELGEKMRREETTMMPWATPVSPAAEAVQALVALGFSEVQAAKAVDEARRVGASGPTEEIVKAALRHLSGGR